MSENTKKAGRPSLPATRRSKEELFESIQDEARFGGLVLEILRLYPHRGTVACLRQTMEGKTNVYLPLDAFPEGVEEGQVIHVAPFEYMKKPAPRRSKKK